MNEFSPSDAALEGFRLTREHPGTILTWSGVYFLGVMLMAIVMAAGLGPQFAAFMRDGAIDQADIEAFSNILVKSWPAFLVVLGMALMLFAILTGGIYRLSLRPQEPGLAHLRLGRDELRLAAVHLMMVLIGMGFLLAFELVIAALGGPREVSPMLVFLVGVALGILMTWVGVRLSLATPMTFAERRISISAAWRLTRGQFWSLFGMIVLAGIFYIMLFLLISVIGYAVVMLGGGQAALADLSHLSGTAIIAFVVTLIIQLLLPILQVVTLYAPFAVAYREITRPAPEPVELPV